MLDTLREEGTTKTGKKQSRKRLRGKVKCIRDPIVFWHATYFSSLHTSVIPSLLSSAGRAQRSELAPVGSTTHLALALLYHVEIANTSRISSLRFTPQQQ